MEVVAAKLKDNETRALCVNIALRWNQSQQLDDL